MKPKQEEKYLINKIGSCTMILLLAFGLTMMLKVLPKTEVRQGIYRVLKYDKMLGLNIIHTKKQT